VLGLGFALFNFKGLANQGEFQSIVLDFRENVPEAEIEAKVNLLAGKYNLEPRLNSEFSAADHVYIARGDRNTIKELKKIRHWQAHRIY
jgi:serine protease